MTPKKKVKLMLQQMDSSEDDVLPILVDSSSEDENIQAIREAGRYSVKCNKSEGIRYLAVAEGPSQLLNAGWICRPCSWAAGDASRVAWSAADYSRLSAAPARNSIANFLMELAHSPSSAGKLEAAEFPDILGYAVWNAAEPVSEG